MGKFFISSEEKGMKEKSLFDLIDESTQKEKLSPGQFFFCKIYILAVVHRRTRV
jgi:hypothetical protein